MYVNVYLGQPLKLLNLIFWRHFNDVLHLHRIICMESSRKSWTTLYACRKIKPYLPLNASIPQHRKKNATYLHKMALLMLRWRLRVASSRSQFEQSLSSTPHIQTHAGCVCVQLLLYASSSTRLKSHTGCFSFSYQESNSFVLI